MTLSMECPQCGTQLTVAADLRGQWVRCSNCGQTFVAGMPPSAAAPREGGIQDRPARLPVARTLSATGSGRPRRLEDDGEPRPRRSSRDSHLGLIVGLSVGGGLLLLLLIVLVIVLAVSSSDPLPEAVVLQPRVEVVPVIPPVQPAFPPAFQPPPQFVQPPVLPPDRVPADADPITRAVAALKSDDIFSQANAARAMEKTPVKEARRAEVVQALKGVLDNRRPLVPRTEAARALGIWSTRAEVPYFLDLLDDHDGGVREAAILALGKLKDGRAADALCRQLKDGFHRDMASQALKEIGPAAERAVLRQLDSGDTGIRIEACRILKVIGTKASHPALRKLARDEDDHVADAAREALPAAVRPPVWGPRQTLKLNIRVINLQAWPAIEAKLKALADDPDPVCRVTTSGQYKWVSLAPVNCDAETFARRINFGRVSAIHNNQRLIYVDSGQ
jgi:predicted Zn finger-like uncharacterized protein